MNIIANGAKHNHLIFFLGFVDMKNESLLLLLFNRYFLYNKERWTYSFFFVVFSFVCVCEKYAKLILQTRKKKQIYVGLAVDSNASNPQAPLTEIM